jgi:hypothetical protein
MNEDRPLTGDNSKPFYKKKSVIVTGVIILLAIIGGASGGGKSSTSSTTTSSSSSSSSSAATNWFPAGFHQWSQDSNMAVMWAPKGYTCKQYENACYKAIFISKNGCPTEFYAAINLLDSSDSVITYSNGTLPSLLPMQKATIDFDDIDGTSKSAQMSTITCR